MDCSNCGKDIPFSGRICPYCHADKSRDKFSLIAFWIGGAPGAIICGKILFTLYPNSLRASLAGMVIGVVAGMAVIYGIRGLLRSLLVPPLSRTFRDSHEDGTLEDKK